MADTLIVEVTNGINNIQLHGLQRAGLEKFYTNPVIAEKCFQLFLQHVKPAHEDLLIEPSAGDGSFVRLMKEFPSTFFCDIQPEHPDVKSMDFLKEYVPPKDRKIHVIGNPPFGRQSSLARSFIKKCGSFAASISFILPKSFKKESFQRSFPERYHLVYQEDLPDDSFLVEGKTYSVPCVFQIWIRKEEVRPSETIESPSFYLFVKKNQDPDFSIRRVGIYAGKVDSKTDDKSEQSHYFLKLTVDIPTFLEDYQRSVTFDFNNTVGPKSISKPELIKRLNRMYLFV